MTATLVLLSRLLVGFAHADDGEDDDLFTTQPPKAEKDKAVDAKAFTDDSEIDMPTFQAPPKVAPVKAASASGPGALPYDLAGKAALADDFAPAIAYVTPTAVVVDLPVVIATDASAFDGVTYWLVLEASADGKKVSETRVQVTRDALAEGAPSVALLRTFVPVGAAMGLIELRVGKATSPAAKPTPVLTRSVPYTRG